VGFELITFAATYTAIIESFIIYLAEQAGSGFKYAA